ncbi:MAG: hypothetical protein OEM63_15465 [Gammaproteobacteria bacterium]|nr:hypothetical protein [Gammaproteobacteria bacterium]
MNPKAYCAVSATLFTLVALAHLARIMNGWAMDVGPIQIPMIASWIGLALPGTLAVWGLREAFGSRA